MSKRNKPLPPTFPGLMMIDDKEKTAVMKVLNSKALCRYGEPMGSLHKCNKFEEEFASYMGVDYALGISSGTAALSTALTGAGIGPGDEVLIPAYTWVASAFSVIESRAIPILAEVDKSLTLSPRDFEAKITHRTKAVMPVHMRGVGCEMDKIMKIARKHGLLTIEDTAQSCGGTYHGKKLGSIGDLGVFSFQQFKIITSGEGGAVITNNKEFFDRCVMFHDAAALAHPSLVKWRFEFEPMMGLNYRMHEIEAAILIEQLHKLDNILSMARKNKEQIRRGISDIEGIELRKIPDPKGDTGICLMFFLPTPEKAQKFVKILRAKKINGPGYGTHVPYAPDKPDWHVYAHWSNLLQKRTFTKEGCPFTCKFHKGKVVYDEKMCPNTLDLLSRAVHIDVSPLLIEEDINSIIEGIHEVAQEMI